jgi:ABC-type nitrate/sulfonate/bicarbonate transport system substrate-binding protein
MKNKKKVWVIIGLCLLVLGGGALTLLSAKVDPDGTSIRLKWIAQAQFAGIYSADANGYYKDAGLDVRIDPAGPNISPIQSVVSGANEFGIAGAEQIIAAVDNGLPIKAVAVIYRETPEALSSDKAKNILSPKDLEGKTIGVVYGDDENLYRLFLKNAGVDEKSVKEVPAITGVSQILTDAVDAKMAYEMNDPILLEIEGKDVNVMRFRDYGVKFYADAIFTTTNMIENQPEKVQKFVQASIKGWEYAIKNPEIAIDQLLNVNSALNRDHQLGYLKASIPIIKTDENIGYSDEEVWQNMIDTLYDNGTVERKLSLESVFTNSFLE